MRGHLAGKGRDALARLDAARGVVAAPVALAQLPRPQRVHRPGLELAVPAGLLDLAVAAGRVLVSAVAGPSGVGKTTLAVKARHGKDATD